MTIETEQNGGTLVVRLAGRLDTNTAPQLQEKVSEFFSESNQVEINCAKLVYVSSAGLRVFLLASRAAQKADAQLTFSQVPDEVMEVFRMTGFSDILQFAE